MKDSCSDLQAGGCLKLGARHVHRQQQRLPCLRPGISRGGCCAPAGRAAASAVAVWQAHWLRIQRHVLKVAAPARSCPSCPESPLHAVVFPLRAGAGRYSYSAAAPAVTVRQARWLRACACVVSNRQLCSNLYSTVVCARSCTPQTGEHCCEQCIF